MVKTMGSKTANPNTSSGGARNSQGVMARDGFIVPARWSGRRCADARVAGCSSASGLRSALPAQLAVDLGESVLRGRLPAKDRRDRLVERVGGLDLVAGVGRQDDGRCVVEHRA